jgi:hypothetical protein
MLAYQTVESFNNDPEAAGKNFETSAHLLDRVVKERTSHRTVSQDGSWDHNNKNLFYTPPLKLLTLSTKENHSRAGALMAVAHRLQSP